MILFGSARSAHVVPTKDGRFNVFVAQYGVGTFDTQITAERVAVLAETAALRYSLEPMDTVRLLRAQIARA